MWSFCIILANSTKICYTYSKLISRTGTSDVIFGYNGRDGVVTDKNGLIYMRARYYSPEMRRFLNADILAGTITNAITLNRYAYANGNPAMFIDPLGLKSWKEKWQEKRQELKNWWNEEVVEPVSTFVEEKIVEPVKEYIVEPVSDFVEEKIVEPVKEYVVEPVQEFFEDVGETVETIAGEINKNLIQPISEDFNSLIEDFKNYDKSNTDESKVLQARHFSSYEGKFVLKMPGNDAFSFGVIFMGRDISDSDTVKHEYGHTVQLENMGVMGYLLNVAIPSVTAYNLDKNGNLSYDYYTAPWEAEADKHGGVSRVPDPILPPWTSNDGYYDFGDLLRSAFNK